VVSKWRACNVVFGRAPTSLKHSNNTKGIQFNYPKGPQLAPSPGPSPSDASDASQTCRLYE